MNPKITKQLYYMYTYVWLRKTRGVGVPNMTTSHESKSFSKASVTLSHCAGPMKARFSQEDLVP